MRRLSFLLLLASAASPALAAPGDHRGGRHSDDSNSEQSDSRSQRSQSESRTQRSQPDRGEQRNISVQRQERSQASQQGSFERARERVQLQRQQQSVENHGRGGNDATGSVRDWRGSTSGQSTNWQQRQRQVRTIPDTQPVVSQHSTNQRDAYRHRRDYRDGNYTRWSNNWRNNSRYDWYNYRNNHRSTFRVGIYYDPFGWNYRRWSIGSYMYPSYYGSSYWLDDPWMYRLPPAYGPYRWVRYWNDALLVNIYSGEVVDVIHGFFW